MSTSGPSWESDLHRFQHAFYVVNGGVTEPLDRFTETRVSYAFEISRATAADIPRLAHIHVVALAEDSAAQLKFSSDAEFYDKVEEMLHAQINDPEWLIVKAISKTDVGDSEIGVIASWASWKLHPIPPQAKDEGQFQFEPGIGQYVRDNTERVFAANAQDERRPYMSLRACFTLPAFRKRGMAGALVGLGCMVADEMRSKTLVQASTMGKGTYEKHRFKVFDHLDVNLGDWEGKGGRKEEGVYRFWYMVRAPKPSSDSDGV